MVFNELEKKYYNNELKRDFLNRFPYHTQLVYERIFYTSKEIEEKFNCDLYNFNLNQFEEVMNGRKPSSLQSSVNNGAIISSYLKWATTIHLRNGSNPIEGKDSSWYEQFISKNTESLFSETTINKLIDRCRNAQDAVIIKLAFEGVGGEGSGEILNLKKQDINIKDNELTLEDINGNMRILKVSEECIKFCGFALKEFEYEKRNGMANSDIKSPFIPLVDNEYVIKTAKTRNKDENKADKHTLYRRIKMLGELFNKPNLTITNIRNSGMLYWANKFLEFEGKLEKEQYEWIFDRFNLNKVIRNGELSFNYYPYKKGFLNVKTIKEIYQKKG